MIVANCRSDKEKITVGEHLLLSCTGNISPDFSLNESKLILNQSNKVESNKYSLKIFKATPKGDAEFHLDFTIYAPGEYKIGDFILTDGVSEIILSGANSGSNSGSNILVESVIKPAVDGKPPEPFGSLFPLNIAIPIYYYLLLVAVLLLAVIYAVFKAKRLSYYRKLKDKLRQYSSAVEPATQFYKAIRTAEKASYPLVAIEKAFRIYNIRAYQLPMFDLPSQRIFKYFKRNFPEYKSTRNNLVKLLDELEEMQKKGNSLTFADKHEFIKKLYRYVEANKGLAQ